MNDTRRDPTPVDVHETQDAFVVSMALEGASPDEVDISLVGNTLTITGELREERQQEGDGGRWVLREQRFGAYERVLTLPIAVDADAATTGFKDGVLTITLPKLEAFVREQRSAGSTAEPGDQGQRVAGPGSTPTTPGSAGAGSSSIAS
jgi:HSP20 family protein